MDMHNNTDTLASLLTTHSLNVLEWSELRQHSAAVAPEQAEKSMTPVLPSQHVQLKGLPAAITQKEIPTGWGVTTLRLDVINFWNSTRSWHLRGSQLGHTVQL